MNMLKKFLIGFILLLIIGVPVIETWNFFLLSIAWLWLIFGTLKENGNIVIVTLVAISILVVKSFIVQANIEEGHNAFIVINPGEVLEKQLPKEVFNSWKGRFDQVYKPNPESKLTHTWELSHTPIELYVKSSDALFNKAKYSRKVNSIYFTDLWEFRGGFSNDVEYNFWDGDMDRRELPFFVMYELTESSVGSSILWTGSVFWEDKNTGFEEIIHDRISGREIKYSDVGMKVYALFIPKQDNIYFKFKPSFSLIIFSIIDLLLSFFGVLFVLYSLVRIRWGNLMRASGVFILAYLISVALLSAYSGKIVENDYAPHGGGDDGLIFEHWGRSMAADVANGDFVKAMSGYEDVYWFTPGTRYFRMVEKLIYGETNFGYMFILSLLPILLFYLIKHLTSARWAIIAIVVYMAIPIGSFSYLQYVANGAKLGYGEAIGGFCYFLGVLLALKTQPRWGGVNPSLSLVWLSGVALAASMFVRPNFSIAVIWLGLAYAYASFVDGHYKKLVAFSIGLSIALWMPFHNWYYGGEFYLISSSGATPTIMKINVMDSWHAFIDAFSGNFDTQEIALVSSQFKGLILNLGLVVKDVLILPAWGYLVIKLSAFVVMIWMIFRWLFGYSQESGSVLPIIAISSIFALTPIMFTVSTHYRYTMLGWELVILWFIAFCFSFKKIK